MIEWTMTVHADFSRDAVLLAASTVVMLLLQLLVERLGAVFARLAPVHKIKDKPQTKALAKKISESVWRFTFYSCALMYGFHVVSRKDYFYNSKNMWVLADGFYPGKSWILGNPPFDVYVYYLVECAFYISATITHVAKTTAAARNKDYTIMLVHHLATLSLIMSSYFIGTWPVGTMVMFLHDCCDPFLEMAKMLKYFNRTTACLFGFWSFGLVFIVTRLVLYPYHVVYSAMVDSMQLTHLDPLYGLFWYFANCLLMVILALNAIWTIFIIRGFVKVVLQGAAPPHDTRSDDETSLS